MQAADADAPRAGFQRSVMRPPAVILEICALPSTMGCAECNERADCSTACTATSLSMFGGEAASVQQSCQFGLICCCVLGPRLFGFLRGA